VNVYLNNPTQAQIKTGRDELIEEIILLQQMSHALGQYSPEAWLDLNLTIGQLKSLFFIDSEGSTNFRKLANALGVTPPDVTRIVDRLVEQGLVSRRENPDDRRMQLLQPTRKGTSLLARLRQNKTTHLHRILTHLSTEELTTVAEGLRSLVRAAGLQREEKIR
jgi:MarR family transcriptional regulator, organic hydroperoxide resistance regulator